MNIQELSKRCYLKHFVNAIENYTKCNCGRFPIQLVMHPILFQQLRKEMGIEHYIIFKEDSKIVLYGVELIKSEYTKYPYFVGYRNEIEYI